MTKAYVATIKVIVPASDYIDATQKIRGAILPISCAFGFVPMEHGRGFPAEVSVDALENLMELKKLADEEEAAIRAGRTYSADDFPTLDNYEAAFDAIGPKTKKEIP